MNIVPYKLATTNDLITADAGLLCLAELLSQLKLSDVVDKHFPSPQSNRGFKASIFIHAFLFMLHQGGEHLVDIDKLAQDRGIRKLLGGLQIPNAVSAGAFLKRMGFSGVTALTEVNRHLLNVSLSRMHCKAVTLDIDASFIASHHQEAMWSYKKATGYFPMFGHIAETGQVLGVEFREGNVSPASDNLGFIEHCESNLPEDVSLAQLRIDAAGYQVDIIDDCIDRKIQFAIRAKMHASLRAFIVSQDESHWQPLMDRETKNKKKPNKKPVSETGVMRLVHTMEKSKEAFTLIVQRTPKKGQRTLDAINEIASPDDNSSTYEVDGYIYRAIATNRDHLSDSDIVHWYNQRAEHSENRIKELKLDFAGDHLPCKDFEASALFLSLCSLAFNVFALLRQLLPEGWQRLRAKTLRHRLYHMAGKVVTHGRQIYLKLAQKNKQLLENMIHAIKTALGSYPLAP